MEGLCTVCLEVLSEGECLACLSRQARILLVTGDRNWRSSEATSRVLRCALDDFQPTLVVLGGARGVDSLMEQLARRLGIETKLFMADWDTYHKAAGPRRNAEMLAFVESHKRTAEIQLAAFHDDIIASKGTFNMLKQGLSPVFKRKMIVKPAVFSRAFLYQRALKGMSTAVTREDIERWERFRKDGKRP